MISITEAYHMFQDSLLLRSLAVVLVGTWLFRACLCFAFGIRIGFMIPLPFRMYNLGYTTKRATVSVRSISLQMSMLDLSTFAIAVEGVKVTLHKTQSTSSDEPPVPKRRRHTLEDMKKLDPDSPVCILCDSKVTNWFIKWYLLYFRFVGVRFNDVRVTSEDINTTFHTETFSIKVDMNHGDKKNVSVKARVIQQKVNDIEVFDSCVLDARGTLNISTGHLSSVTLDFDARTLKLRVYTLLKKFMKGRGLAGLMSDKHADRVLTEEDILDLIHTRLQVFCNMVRLIERNSMSFQGIEITEIPLASKELLQCPEYKPLVFLHLKVNSFVSSWERLYFQSPGYGLMYEYTDKPFKIVYNCTGISVSMEHIGKSAPREIITVPVLNINGSSNFAFQTLEAIISEKETKSKLLFAGHLSEPIIDMSTDDISIAVSSALDFLTYFRRMDLKTQKPYTSTSAKKRSLAQKWEVAKNLSSVWPAVELKLGIENPVIMTKSLFRETNYRMLLLKLHMLSMELRTSREMVNGTRQYITRHKFDMHNTKIEYRNSESQFDKRALRLEDISIKQQFDILPQLKLSTVVHTESTKLNLSDITMLHGINFIFSELDEKIVPQIRDYRRLVNSMEAACASRPCAPVSDIPVPEDNRSTVQIVQDMIPHWAKKVEILSNHIAILVGSRSLLLNKDLVKSIDPQTRNDLVNGDLRTVELYLENWGMVFQSGSSCRGTATPSTGSSLEDDDKGLLETASDTTDDLEGWSLKFHSAKVVGKIVSERSSNRDVLHEKVFLKIPSTYVLISPCEADDKLILKWRVERVEGLYSVITHFILISSMHLVRNTIFEFMLKNPVGESRKSGGQGLAQKITSATEIDVSIGFVDAILILPDRMKMRVEFTDVSSRAALDRPVLVGASYSRLCTESPTTPGYWTRLLTAVDGCTRVNTPTIVQGLEGPWFELGNDTCHISTPHHLIIYKIFDNISVMVKTLKQLHHSLKFNSDEIVITPRAKGPTKVPKMNFRSRRLVFSMEDDPFEAELNMIFQIGLVEQKMRYEKIQIFEKKLADDLQNSKKVPVKAFTDDQLGSLPKPTKKKTFKGLHHSNSISTFPQTPVTKDPHKLDTDVRIADVREQQKKLMTMYEGFSKSWIARVKAYRFKMEQNFKDNFEFLWGPLDLTSFPAGFNRKVLDFVTTPSLFNLIFEGVDMGISPPLCGFDGLSDFLYDVGKGLPRDTQFSTLIPVHIDLKLAELRSHLRDYPLPFVNMPRTSKRQPRDLPAIRIHGDLVIGENMIKSQAEVREVYVPLVPGCQEFDEDECYSIEVPKTLTAIKVYTSLDWELNSELATSVTWGTSYQPGIQQVMLNLDNFTKPPIDPSEKVGFWDKLRANFHARISFKWVESGKLHIIFKGSMNPYAIGGESSGFLLGFKNNVTLNINENDDPRDFLKSGANEIMFAVPNHFARRLPVWNRAIGDSVLLWDITTNFQQSAFGYYLADNSQPLGTQSDTLSLAYIEKAVIRLAGGVQFNLSFFFERKLEDGSSRSSEFSPHYNVTLTNPKYVEDRDSYDAYRGFRSQYIHMGFTLISQHESAYNTIQLTPTAFQYFFAWWKLFSNTLPIRHGRLFGPDRTSKKFSRHLYTIKYQALLEPLFVSHVYRDVELVAADSNRVDCVGVKGRAKKLILDLHQRKELTFEHNANLGVTKKSMKTKFNLGKVDLEEFDVRVVEGFFDKMTTDLHPDVKDNVPAYNFDSFDGDSSWFDLADFAEIDEALLSRGFTGQINAYPLMFTPRFIYFKRQSYGDKYQVDAETGKRVTPFGNETFHKCYVGQKPSVLTQGELFDKRLAELETKLEENLSVIEEIPHSTATPAQWKLIKQLKVDNEQLKHAIKAVTKLAAAYGAPESENLMRVSSVEFAIDENPEEESFTNRFIVHNMMLKWNDKSRDGFYRYIYLFELRGQFFRFKHHKSLSQLDEAIASQRNANYGGETSDSVSRVPTYESHRSEKKSDYRESMDDTRATQRMKFFKEELREIAVNFFYKVHDNYLVKLISPQIQLQCEGDKHAAVLVTAPKIELNIVAFDAAEVDDDYDENIFEQRFGAILEDASIFVFHEKEILTTGKLFFNSSSYGSTSAWPPWVGVELCYDGSLIHDHVLVEKTSIMVRYDKVMNPLFGSEDTDVNRLSCDLSQAFLTCDADQYSSLYTIIMELLIYNDPRSLKLKQMESKMGLSLDLNDLSAIKSRIVALQEAIGHTEDIIANISSRRVVIDDLQEDDLKLVRAAKYEADMELYLLMKVSVLGSRKSTEEADDYLEWNVRADDIKLHMLDEFRHPFLDVILFNSHFKRVERSDRSDTNHIVIENLEVINLDKHSNLPVVFSAHEVKKKPKKIRREADEEPLIHITWQMDYPVGGIRIMKKFEIALQPIQVSFEEILGEKIMRYAFPYDTGAYSSDSDDDDAHSHTRGQEPKKRFSFVGNTNGNGLSSTKSTGSLKSNGKPALPQIKMNGGPTKHVGDHFTPDTPRSSMSLSTRSRDGHIDSMVMSESSDYDGDGLDEMVQRASKYLSFVSFKLRSTVVAITFRGKGSKKLINVTNFVLNLPEICFTNKTYTLLDLTMHIKKVLIKALLSHTGSIIGNKLSKRGSVEKSLKNLSHYATNRIHTFRDD